MAQKLVVVMLLLSISIMPACSDAKEHEARVRAPASAMIQEPVVAGMFYPADGNILEGFVQRYLEAAPKKELKGHLLALVAPHAGYRYSGLVAATAFKQVEGRQYKRVVVLAPSHRVPLTGVALSTRDYYRTPLGDIPIDTDAVNELIQKYTWATDDQRPFTAEHALEVELPFLQTVLKDFKLVPIIVGAHDEKMIMAIADGLNETFPGDDVLFISSTDLSHYKPYDEAIEADKRTLKLIEKGDAGVFWKSVEGGQAEACGAVPIGIVMKIWRLRGGGDIEVLQYLNSGDTAGDKSRVVGYAAIALLTKGGMEYGVRGSEYEKQHFTLTEKQKQKLLDIARKTVVAHVKGKKLPSIATDDPMLREKGAVFVTLRKKDELRGCIGHIIAREPLIENVRNMAVAASSSDARFPPVRPEELGDIHVEVSVLTPPQPLDNPMSVEVGTDGLIIQRGFNRGVLLPQVPTEQGWNKDQYLSGICRKAGMEPTCWKDAKLEKFQAIVFGE